MASFEVEPGGEPAKLSAAFESPARFRQLVEQISEYAIFFLDREGHIATWNAGAERIKGYRADEIIGQHFSKFYRPEDRWKCAYELDVARREGRVEDEGWRVRKDGTTFWANVVITAIRETDGSLIGFAKVTRDLTERRGAEESLRHSEERFRLLVESVKDYAIFMLDPQGIVTTWNVGAERIKGYRADEIIGQHFSRFYPEEDVRAGKCEMELDVASREGRFEDENWRVRKDGSRFWANVVITALRDTSGALIGFAKVTRDLTERKRAEEERLRVGEIARERIQTFATLSEALSGVLSVADVGRVVSSVGASLAGADTVMLYLRDDRTNALALVAQSGCDPQLLERLRRITRDSASPVYPIGIGERDGVWIESAVEYDAFFPSLARMQVNATRAQSFWCLPLVAEGRAIGMLGAGFHAARHFAQDERDFVTTFARQCAQALARARRLDAEREAATLAEARRTFHVEATAVLTESLDYEETVTRVAHLAVPRLADWCILDLVDEGETTPRRLAVAHADPSKDALAHVIQTKYAPRLATPSRIPTVLRTGRAQLYPDLSEELVAASAIDDEHLRIARELAPVSAMIVPLPLGGRVLGTITFLYAESGRRYSAEDLAFAEDLAQRCANAVVNARLFRAEQHARKAADLANRAKDDFLAVVSHELRTPLNAIMGWAKMLSTRELDERRRFGAFETIERNAVAMAQLIEDLLDMSRMISGKMRLEVQQVSVPSVVEAAIDSVRPAAAARSVELVPVLDNTLPTIVGDPTRLQQVVWNLLSNAVKFSAKGGRVSVLLRKADSAIEIVVSDRGKGIAPSFLPYVFDAFRQEDASPSRSRGGLGLGLAITRQIVELHGGRIVAESEGEGMGATFSVVLPITAITAKELREQVSRQIRPEGAFERPAHLRGLRVLAVDDDPDARGLVAAVLEECGCIVTTANSVADGMAKLVQSVPDVLISDIGMPDEDGYDLIRKVRALPRERGGDVPAAALTAYARPEDRRRMLNSGYSIHLPKPVEPAELVAVVATLSRFIHRP